MANDRQCEYGPTEIRAIWENTCDLLKQNLQCEADVFPLRAKTPQYTESVYKWAENNKKIVDTIKHVPVFTLGHNASIIIAFSSQVDKLCIPVFLSEEQAKEFCESRHINQTDVQIIQESLAKIAGLKWAGTGDGIFHHILDDAALGSDASFYEVPQDVETIEIYDCRDGRQAIFLDKAKIHFMYAETLHHSPYPPGITAVVQTMPLQIVEIIKNRKDKENEISSFPHRAETPQKEK